jgi:hypothetical protein
LVANRSPGFSYKQERGLELKETVEENQVKHTLKGISVTREVWLDGKILWPEKSQKYHNHSPDGFNWSYSGSGCAQLALAIILELTGQAEGYQMFKEQIIARIPEGNFEIEFDKFGETWAILSKEKPVESQIKCQACGKHESQVILQDDVAYRICHNCLLSLVARALAPEEYLNLVEIHGNKAFLLHEDFYDDEGHALQPAL